MQAVDGKTPGQESCAEQRETGVCVSSCLLITVGFFFLTPACVVIAEILISGKDVIHPEGRQDDTCCGGHCWRLIEQYQRAMLHVQINLNQLL